MNVSGFECRGRPVVKALLTAGCLAVLPGAAALPAAAARLVVTADVKLADAVAAAPAGAVIEVAAGRHRGPIVLDRALTLKGRPGAVIDGGGVGSVVTVSAAGVVLTGLTIRHSGTSLSRENAGIFVTAAGDGAVIEHNRLEGNLFGVFLKGPEGVVVRDNVIVGRADLRMNERGNGIHLWNSPGSLVANNHVRFGRDGVFVTTSRENRFLNNTFRDLRFAIHYMYTNVSEVSGNLSKGNHAGYALMFSSHLKVHDNVSDGDRDRGLLLNYANSSEFAGNWVRGAEKCVFIYNANKNSFVGNRFERCAIGIHFTAGSERNVISGNAFIDSRTQVKYVGTRNIEWSLNGRGNYWSDNMAFDLNGDGIADRPYRPNDLVDQILWRHPGAKILVNSPAIQVLRWAQSAFPNLHPGGVTDSAPLMKPPVLSRFAGLEAL